MLLFNSRVCLGVLDTVDLATPLVTGQAALALIKKSDSNWCFFFPSMILRASVIWRECVWTARRSRTERSLLTRTEAEVGLQPVARSSSSSNSALWQLLLVPLLTAIFQNDLLSETKKKEKNRKKTNVVVNNECTDEHHCFMRDVSFTCSVCFNMMFGDV